MPRFLSLTFVAGFGIGIVIGVSLALLAIALSTTTPVEEHSVLVPLTATPRPSTPVPDATATPEPGPRTVSAQAVRIGPSGDYAIIGTIARGTAVNVLGRDDEGNWVVINFPPGSSARGWVLAESIEGLGHDDRDVLGVAEPTPLPQSFELPRTSLPDFVNPFPTPILGGIGGDGPGLIPVTPALPLSNTGPPAETPALPAATPTPAPLPLNVGPTDLVAVRMALVSGGDVAVTVTNAGPGDIPSGLLTVQVDAGTYGSRSMTYGRALRAGESATLSTSGLGIGSRVLVTATVDAAGSLSDTNRGNNSLLHELAP